MSKCPHCGKLIAVVFVNQIAINAPGRELNGVSYSCQHCQALLSVGIDPVALQNDIAAEVVRQLRRG